jgi:hypothetical protein
MVPAPSELLTLSPQPDQLQNYDDHDYDADDVKNAVVHGLPCIASTPPPARLPFFSRHETSFRDALVFELSFANLAPPPAAPTRHSAFAAQKA